MGGQNHQPTDPNAAAISALVSQRVGRGFECVLRANSCLENAIIVGMNKLYVEDMAKDVLEDGAEHLREAIASLNDAKEELFGIDAGFNRMFEALKAEGYKGNPLISKLVDFELGSQFSELLVKPTVNETIWKNLEVKISTDYIVETLKWEQSEFRRCLKPLDDLILLLEAGLEIVDTNGARAFVDTVEHNELPLRQYYARVFSFWNYLHNMFLYSSLIMTELFYRSNGIPSLLEFEPVVSNERVA